VSKQVSVVVVLLVAAPNTPQLAVSQQASRHPKGPIWVD
jgi:hypothetical protein